MKLRGRGGGRGHRVGSLWALCLVCVLSACKRDRSEIVVFHADSLSTILGDVAGAYQKANPGYRVRLEPSESQVAVRKIAELGMRADLVAVADAGLLSKMMIPAHASWSAIFATNEIVLAHKDHSRFTDQITAGNWAEVLLRDGVRLGRVDPDTAPIGYQTLMVWQLAEGAGQGGANAGLAARLLAKCAPAHVTHDEADLLALLESRAVDYAFLLRSTAEDHHLKILTLPPEINLSRQDMAARYATASVEIRMKQGQATGHITGGPITYGLTIPSHAPHADGAAHFAAFLLGEAGRRMLNRRGFHPLAQARCAPCAQLPAPLGGLVLPEAAATP